MQNACKLLEENLSPSLLFEHRDIQSLAAYLAATYPAKVDAVTAVRQGQGEPQSADRLEIRAPRLTSLAGTRRVSEGPATTPRSQAGATASMSIEEILERVSWQEASPEDGYEKVTFSH